MPDKYCMTALEYAEMDRPDLDFLWAGMIPRPSIVVLEGAPKVGKSFLALQIAKAVAEGAELGGRPCKQARVLYLILEDEITWYDRMMKLIKVGYTFPPMLFMPQPFHRDKPFVQHIVAPETQRWLSGMLREADPEMVVIDPLREIHTLDEQDSTQMKIVGDALVTIFHGRTMFVLHHTKKYEPDPENPHPPNPILAGRGSSYLAGKASAVWQLWKARIEDRHGLLQVAPRFAEYSQINLVQQDTGLWQWQTTQVIPVENLPPDVLVCTATPLEHPGTPGHGDRPPDHSAGKLNGQAEAGEKETGRSSDGPAIPLSPFASPSTANSPGPSASDGS